MANVQNSDADRMASYIQELLLQDQSRQRASLDNLSKYTDEKLGGDSPTQESMSLLRAPALAGFGPSQWNSFGDQGEAAVHLRMQLPKAPELPAPPSLDMPMPGKLANMIPGFSEALEAETAAGSHAPIKLDLAHASLGKVAEQQARAVGQQQNSNPPAAAAAHQRLQQATQVLQAALANWESCVHESSAVPPEEVASVERMVNQLSQGGIESMAGYGVAAPPEEEPLFCYGVKSRPSQPPGLSSQALSAGPSGSATAAANGESLEKAANFLEKALFDLNRHLPAETAQMAHSLLEGVTETSEGLTNTEEQDKLKWLSQYLESQNKVSIERLSKLLQDPAPVRPHAAGFGQGSAATAASATNHQAWHMPPSSHAALAAAHMGAGGSSLWANAVHHGLGGLPLAAQGANAYLGASAIGGAETQWPWGGHANAGGLHTAGMAAAQAPEMRKGGGPKRRTTMPQAGGAGGLQGVAPVEQTGETLRMHLRSLLHVESSRVLIVRKINRLGFSSPAILKERFSWFGNVEQVLVAHSRVKSGGGQAGIVSRLRPSGLGFVVMSQTEEAEAILAQGHEQEVCGTLIRVQKFARRMAEEAGSDAEDDKGEVVAGDNRAMGA